MTSRTCMVALIVATVAYLTGPAGAVLTEQASLNACQNAVRTAATEYVGDKVGAIGTCLQAISTQLIENNAADTSKAAATCVTQFRKLNDSRSLGKSLPEKLEAAIEKACEPSSLNTHTLNDILGPGATVSQPINADNAAAWCANFGGNGSIASLTDWLECIETAQKCGVATQISTQYPQALEWLGLVRTSMASPPLPAPPSSDPNKISDAVAGLDAVVAELKGSGSGSAPQFQCGNNGLCDGNLMTCNTDLETCTGNLSTCNAKLATVNSGTAAVGNVLSGKTFSSSAGLGLTGTMPNNGAVNIVPGTSAQPIPAGYHSGAGSVAGDANLVSGNIKNGASIFGVAGSVIQASGNAGTGDVLSGKTFSNASGAGVGAMPNNGAVNIIPGTSAQPIPAGYHSGTGSVAGDANLVSGNIKSGTSIFGVAGNPAVVDTSGASATPADMASGKTAYVNGSLVTGSVLAGSSVNGPNGARTFTIPDGLYSGSETATANDTNLVGGNIVTGVSIFGVAGTQPPSQPLKTGQTTAYGTGSDGDVQKGDGRSFTDNGDGTITDNKTGLMWEKKSRDGSIHDWGKVYTWSGGANIMDGTITTTFLAALNAGGGFAGHTDWRIPNQNELLTLVNYENSNPVVDAAFNTNCVASCTVLTCSCTQSLSYWSSTTYRSNPTYTWGVSFSAGYDGALTKGTNGYVRAVRAGL